jgi:hypothetical protein
MLATATAASSVAGIVTAFSAAVTAIGGVIVVLTVFIPMLRTTKEVKHIVNQQQTDLKNYQRALIDALKIAGVDIPVDQSHPIQGQ